MTAEKAFFIRILSDFLNERPTAARSDVDWSVVDKLSRIHQVSGIVYRQCKEFLPEPYAAKYENCHVAELFYYYNRMSMLDAVAKELSARTIPFYTVKGLDVAQFYPVPALRTMGDCDIIVHPEDKQKAHEAMVDLGFSVRLQKDMDWVYLKNKMEFEIHDHLLYDEPGNNRESRDHTDTAWEHAAPTGKGTRYRLDWDFHCLFLILHLKKHLVHSGVGFRQFMDIAVLARQDCVDWEKVKTALQSVNLLRFGQICFGLLHLWFGTPLLLGATELSPAFAEEATEKVFQSGVFGFDDEQRDDILRMNAITQTSGPRWWARVQSLTLNVFPPYHKLRYEAAYPFLDGRPWLLPAAWVYRIAMSIRRRRGKTGREMLEGALISADKLDARERELQKWGLR